jgi:hypothetical protein
MTEDTARFWAANNNKVIARIELPAQSSPLSRPGSGVTTGPAYKAS